MISEIPVTVEVTRVVEVTSEPVTSGTEATTISTEVVEKTVEGEKDRVGLRVAVPDLHDGKGMTLMYRFFEGELDPSSVSFVDFLLKPGTYAGYHRHEGNMEILYILSGKAENFQDGKREDENRPAMKWQGYGATPDKSGFWIPSRVFQPR